MNGRVAVRGSEPSQHHEPEVIELGLVRVPPTLQDALKIRHANPPCRPGHCPGPAIP